MTRCATCQDQTLEPRDAFCPNCGAFARPLEVELSPAGGAIADTVSLRVVDRGAVNDDEPFEPDGICLILAVDGPDGQEIVDSVDLAEVLYHHDSGPLTGLARAAAGGAPLTVEVLARRPGFDPAGRPLASSCYNQQPPELSVASGQVSADAIGADDRILIKLHNAGGAAWIRDVRARVEGVSSAATASEDIAKGALMSLAAAGKTSIVTAWISKEESDALATLRGQRRGQLIVNIDGIERPQVVPIQWQRPQPPSVELEVDPSPRGLIGRRLRLSAAIRNTGGRSLRVTEVQVGYGAGHWRKLPAVPARWRSALAPDATAIAELRPWLTEDGAETGAPLRRGAHRLEIKIALQTCDEGGVEPLESRVAVTTVEIRPDRVFEGRVAIDFGTTESAVAATTRPLPSPEQPIEGPPFVVELDCVGLPVEGAESSRFLKTSLTLDDEGEWHVGADAEEVLADRPAVAFDRFKWSLVPRQTDVRKRLSTVEAILERVRQGQDVPTATVDGELLLTAFLGKVRALIEEHPRIAARITPENVVFATRPVVFAEGQTDALIRAYEKAGFGNPLDHLFGGERTLILESWPPTLLTITTPEDEHIFRELTPGGVGASRRGAVLPFGEEWGQAAHIVIYDVGGGSADISVLRIVQDEHRYPIITEVASETSTDFAGLNFEKLIGGVLEEWMRNETGGDFDRSSVDAEARAAFDTAVRRFQWNSGLLAPLSEIIEDLIRSSDASFEAISRTLNAQLEKDLQLRLRIQDQHLHTVHLLDSAGQRRELGLDGFQWIVGQIVSRFLSKHRPSLTAMADRLRAKAQLGPKDPLLRLIISGRGATFPLAFEMIDALWSEYLASSTAMLPLTNEAAKSVTSWAGLHLADLLRSDGLFFEPASRALHFGIRQPRRSGVWVPPVWMTPAEGHGSVVATLAASKLSRVVHASDVVVVRGAESVEHLDHVGSARWPSGDKSKMWVLLLKTPDGFEVAIREGEDAEAAMADVTQESIR